MYKKKKIPHVLHQHSTKHVYYDSRLSTFQSDMNYPLFDKLNSADGMAVKIFDRRNEDGLLRNDSTWKKTDGRENNQIYKQEKGRRFDQEQPFSI